MFPDLGETQRFLIDPELPFLSMVVRRPSVRLDLTVAIAIVSK